MQTRFLRRDRLFFPGRCGANWAFQAGDAMDVSVEAGRIVLMPYRKTRKARIITDAIRGLPVLTAGKDAPALSSREVAEILAEFP